MSSLVAASAPPAPLVQTTLTSVNPKTAAKCLKRKLALDDGNELDLNAADIPITPQVVEAMKRRIIELEDQLSAAAEAPPAKRARTSAAAASSEPVVASSSTSASTAANAKADEKKRKIQVKKIFDRLKKECKSDSVKFNGGPKSIKFDEVFEQSEFEALFGGKGTLIQPTPENKPKSTVTIIHFNAAQAIDFFGGDLRNLKGNAWTRGGAPYFSKSVKLGACDLTVTSLEVNYSKNGMKCTLKFGIEDEDGVGGVYGPNGRWMRLL